MTTINRAFCKTLRADLEAAVKAIAEKHGASIEVGNMRYDSNSINTNIRLVMTEGGESEGVAMLKELAPDLVGKECRLQGERFKITEVLIDSRGKIRKTRGDVAVGIVNAKGKSYKTSLSTVRNCLIVDDTSAPTPASVAPKAPEAPKSPVTPAGGSKKEQMINFMIKNPNSARKEVINYFVEELCIMTPASASSTYQNAKRVVDAYNAAK